MNKNSMMNFQYNMVSYVPNFVKGFSYLLSPKHLGSYVDRFLKAYDKLKVGGVSLRDLGNEILYSDFRREKEVDRQQANAIITEQIKKIKDSGYNILIDGGNASAIPYAKSILNIPLDSSHLNICDDTVPFYQMVIHGYIEYAGEPINLAQDYKRNILKVVETGAGIYYKWIYADSHLLKDTNFDGYYSINYKERIDEAKELYGKVNSFLKDVQDQKIVNHEILQPNVYKTTYENGKAVIVNYNKNMVFVDGIKIQGEDYYEVKGGDQR